VSRQEKAEGVMMRVMDREQVNFLLRRAKHYHEKAHTRDAYGLRGALIRAVEYLLKEKAASKDGDLE